MYHLYDLESSASLKRCRCEATWRRFHIISYLYFKSCLHCAWLFSFSYDRPQGPGNIFDMMLFHTQTMDQKPHAGFCTAGRFVCKECPVLSLLRSTNNQWLDQSVVAISTSHYFTMFHHISPHSSSSTIGEWLNITWPHLFLHFVSYPTIPSICYHFL